MGGGSFAHRGCTVCERGWTPGRPTIRARPSARRVETIDLSVGLQTIRPQGPIRLWPNMFFLMYASLSTYDLAIFPSALTLQESSLPCIHLLIGNMINQPLSNIL
jgi:hypothetical protein